MSRALAALALLLAFVVAAAAPFLANGRPWSMGDEAVIRGPLVRSLDRTDYVWIAVPALVGAAMLARAALRGRTAARLTVWPIAVSLCAGLLIWAALDRAREGIRAPALVREIEARAALAESLATIARDLAAGRSISITELDQVNSRAGALLAVQEDLAAARDAAVAAGGGEAFGAALRRNEARLAALRGAHLAWRPYGPDDIDPRARRQAPGATPAHPLGTDGSGRDLLSQLVWGTRSALETASITALLALLLGAVVGGISGYLGGWTDRLLMRVVEGFQCLPVLSVLFLVTAYASDDRATVVVFLSLMLWTTPARLVRAETLRLRGDDSIDAARALGASTLRILGLHLLPRAIAPLRVHGPLLFGSVVVAESALAFLGLGDETRPNLGALLADARKDLDAGSHLALYPGAVLFILMLALSRVAEKRDV